MALSMEKVYDGAVKQRPVFHLKLFDFQENLPMPGVSIPDTAVPSWNSDPDYNMINEAFFFAEKHLEDHGCIVVFHS